MSSDHSWLRTYLIGICMGSADAVPGVSGGTIALITGIYERLIDAITDATPERAIAFVRALWPPTDPDVATIREVWTDVDATFLLTLGMGIVTAVILVTRAVHVLQEAVPAMLFGFFFGLIAASAIVLWRQVSLDRPRYVAAAVVGFTIAFVLSGNVEILSGHSLPLTMLAGAVAVSAMILPGISGSLILVILGQYIFMTETLSTFVDRLLALASGGSVDRLVEPGTTVVVFVTGALIGLLTISRAVDYALENDRETTLAFLVALVVGALRAPIVAAVSEGGVVWTTTTVGEFAVAAVVGAVVLYLLDYYAVDVTIGESDADANGRAEPKADD